MDFFAKRNPEKGRRTQEIKALIAELLELDQDATVMVAELNCQDDECPGIETMIAVFRPDRPKLQITLHAGVDEVTDVEIEQFCRNAQI